ncbi:Alkaline phosphatase [Ascochyta rabiei]|nr:Alkaline phosphatase [Ascochyta rabiei]UPX16034.1 Alkaline phosphatase [Ascochyta rabiei]
MDNMEESFNEFGGISFDERKMNAVRAFQMGKLLDLVMLDTRSYDRSITRVGWNDKYVYDISNDAGRSIMGSHQENWFFRQLSSSQDRGAVCRIIGNQMIFSHINRTGEEGDRDIPVDVDAWDGFVASHNRTLKHLHDNIITNTIMLAGDSHQNWVSDLVWQDAIPHDPVTGAGAIGVEFATMSAAFVRDNDALLWQEGYYRGYTELHISRNQLEARYWGCPTIATRNALKISLANFTVAAGANHIARPVATGAVEAGAIADGQGELRGTNLTKDLETGEWFVHDFDTMCLEWALGW